MKFKSGDKVKYLGGIDKRNGEKQPEYDYLINSVATILSYYPEAFYPIELEFEDGYIVGGWESEIELIGGNPNCKSIRI